MRWLASLVTGLVCISFALAADWPQWLGPNRDGATTEVVKPWKGDLKVLWRTNVGEGHSSPVVANGFVFLHTKGDDDEQEALHAWRVDDPSVHASIGFKRDKFSSQFGNGPRATPLVYGDHVWCLGATGDLTMVTWRKQGQGLEIQQAASIHAAKNYQAPPLMFGVSASPLLENDKIVVQVGGKKGSIGAFNSKTNEEVWHALNDPPSYAAPVAIGKGEQRQIVCLTQKRLVGLSPKDGELLWEFPFKDQLAESSTTPVLVGDLLIASSVTLGSVGLKFTEKSGKPTVEQAWKNPALTCYFSTPVPVGEQLYMINGSFIPPPSATLRCIETKTGKVLWSKPKVGKYHAALIRTGDDKLLMLDDSGSLTLIQPDPAGYKELARSKICGETWAHPALANGKLYVRDNKELICVELGEK
ncbi:MAG TPA: PQQ-binding-like beta-propeller repeat protein [Gemmataceae bacterium]|nr:PQQ-binding-like beta-propeller repeat protein [Gemmataceae bacterium]